MPKGVHKLSEEQKKKISEARKKYFDEHGRVVDIDQMTDPRAYQREYQKIYRQRHPNYYKEKRRLKAVNKEVTLEQIVTKFNEIQAHFIEVKYRTREFKQEELESLATELKRLMMAYILLLKNECGVKDED